MIKGGITFEKKNSELFCCIYVRQLYYVDVDWRTITITKYELLCLWNYLKFLNLMLCFPGVYFKNLMLHGY